MVKSKDTNAAVELVRAELFKDNIASLRMNERGQFYLNGKLVPFPTLLKAFAAPPDDAPRGKTLPRWLKVTLPEGAKPTDAVFNFRLKQLAAAADRIGLRHGLFPEKDNKPDN